MKLKRILNHLLMTEWQLHRAFSSTKLKEIEQAIKVAEQAHSGELRFVVEAALDSGALLKGQTATERALEIFSQLRIWDTAQNNGVLIYLLFADRDVEIIADRGIHAKVGTGGWEQICRLMEDDFRQGDYLEGAISGIEAVARHLSNHFPAAGNMDKNELPDAPLLL